MPHEDPPEERRRAFAPLNGGGRAAVAEPATAPAPGSTGATGDPLDQLFASELAQLNKQATAGEARIKDIERAEAGAKAETERLLQERRKGIAEAAAPVEAALRRPMPSPPEAPTEPPVPRQRLRPFMDGMEGESGMQVAQRVLTSLGLLAQMSAGVYTRGALTAYSGALRGWADGDAKRAEREFQEYLAGVEKMSREYTRRRQQYGEVMEQWGHHLDAAKAMMAVKAAEFGDTPERIDLARRDPEQLLKVAQLDAQIVGSVRRDSTNLMAQYLTKKGTDQFRREQMSRLDDYRRASLALRAKSLQQGEAIREALLRRGDLKVYIPQLEAASKTADGLNRIEQAFAEIEREHPELVPKGPELVASWVARVQRVLKPGDERLAVIQRLWPEVVIGGFSRGFWDEKGLRAQVAFLPQLSVGEQLPPGAAFHRLLREMRGMMRESAMKRLKEMETMRVGPEVLAVGRMFADTLGDPEEAALTGTLLNLFQ